MVGCSRVPLEAGTGQQAGGLRVWFLRGRQDPLPAPGNSAERGPAQPALEPHT